MTFTAGQTSQDITVTVTGDTAAEADETFTVTLSAPSGATVGTATSTVTITNDDVAVPVVSISPVNISVVEGNSGSKTVTFTVDLSRTWSSTVTVGYATANGSATAGQDYTAASGTVTFAAGQTSQQVSVTVLGDVAVEPDETFTVTLSAPSEATLGTATSTATITNDDLSVPGVSISPVSVTLAEGNSGSKTVTFTVSLSQAAGSTVTVGYATANGSATAGQDYTAASGTVTFTAGQIAQQIDITVLGDAAVEVDETFTLTLSAPSGATLGAAKTSTVTITNDDVAATVVSISPVSTSVAEGNSGSKAVTFTVSLSQAAGSTVTVKYATANGSATAGQDYTAVSGTVTFTAGQISKQVSVTVLGDTAAEADETFSLTLSAPSGASLGAVKTSTVTITNDDLPTVSISPVSVSVVEGNSGSKAVTFTVSLSQAAGSTVTVKYATANGSATAGQDYTAVSGTVTFTAGQISKQVSVTVLGDTAAEADETFSLTLSAPSGASLGAVKTSTVTITNDDLPTVSISPVSVSVVEGNSGSKAVTFTVSLSQAAGSTVTVGYATANGSATAGQDYTAASGTVTFTAGQTSQQVSVTVAGDAAIEADETFTLTLSAPLGASLGAVKTSTVTITNDDLPAVSISPVSVSVAEGNSGSKAVTFTVSLSQSAGSTVTVRYATANGSATAGQDYTAASGTLTFTIGQTSKQVSVTVLGDRTVEADETLTLTLSAPTGAVLGAGKTATVTITNDDKAVAAKVVPPTPLGANLAVSDGQTGLRPEFATQTLVVSTLRKKAAA